MIEDKAGTLNWVVFLQSKTPNTQTLNSQDDAVFSTYLSFPSGSVVENPPAVQEMRRGLRFAPWFGKIP